MEITTTPDIYEPSVDTNNNYIDILPPVRQTKNGIRCLCTREDKVFNRASFSAYMKTKCHKIWLYNINANKCNYFTENTRLKENIETQKQIIANLSNELAAANIQLQAKENSIKSLAGQLAVINTSNGNQLHSINLIDC